MDPRKNNIESFHKNLTYVQADTAIQLQLKLFKHL